MNIIHVTANKNVVTKQLNEKETRGTFSYVGKDVKYITRSFNE